MKIKKAAAFAAALSFLAAAAGKNDEGDNDDPEGVIIKEITQAVVHDRPPQSFEIAGRGAPYANRV